MTKPKARPDYTGSVVRLVWEDAFDEADVEIAQLRDKTTVNTYGKVVRQNDYLISVATCENLSAVTVNTTSVLWSMVVDVEVLEESE